VLARAALDRGVCFVVYWGRLPRLTTLRDPDALPREAGCPRGDGGSILSLSTAPMSGYHGRGLGKPTKECAGEPGQSIMEV
jgi:hypothetical protein